MKYRGMEITIQNINCIDDIMRDEYKALHKVTNQIKKLSKDSKEFGLLKKIIKDIRFSLSNKVNSIWRVSVSQKNKYVYHDFREYPTAADIKTTREYFISKLKEKRKQKVLAYESKTILGYAYKTIGGVFDKKGSILSLQGKDQKERIREPKVPPKQFKANYVGVELELFCKMDRSQLLEIFCKHKLGGYVYVKDDGSIRSENNYFGHEVTILCRQDMIRDIIPKIVDVLRLPIVDAAVNNSCGMHIHIDVRNRDAYQVYNRLVRSLPLLKSIVPYERSTNKFCVSNESDNLGYYYIDGKVENGTQHGRDTRYRAINPMSVRSHTTIEVRLHSGTVNKEKIINWLDICTSIVDCQFDGSIETPEHFFNKVKQDAKLLEYMNKRKDLFSKGMMMDGKADHILDLALVAGF